ncbi:hypothetical protein TRVL_07686 [Trypanosoma vivax]|nr:hypothetical protein TRVL_07686 [Trypanosoma vivax]
MFQSVEDGSAVVSQIPVSPFVPIQHNRIDVTTVNRIANFGLRFALENGWLRRKLTSGADHNGTGPQSGVFVDLPSDVTTFYAGVDAELAEGTPQFDGAATPANMFFHARFWISHIGTSSNMVLARLSHYKAGEDTQMVPLGTFRLAVVHVSRTTRKPVPIPGERLQIMRALLAMNSEASKLPAVERIDVKEVMNGYASIAQSHSCDETRQSLPTHSTAAPLKCAYVRDFQLRDTDIDHNRHVNQMVQMQLVVNTFRSAMADAGTVFPRLLDDGVEPLVSDLLLRRLRIDYVREISMEQEKVRVTLFFLDEASCEAIVGSACGKRHGRAVELWFVIQTDPSQKNEAYVAAVGKVFVYC